MSLAPLSSDPPPRPASTAKQTNYISPKGDHTAAVDMPVDTTKQSWYFLTGIDVTAPREVGAVVALGDSLTDGNLSTADANSRWTDALAGKLHWAGVRMGVMNQGTGGGRVLHTGSARAAPSTVWWTSTHCCRIPRTRIAC